MSKCKLGIFMVMLLVLVVATLPITQAAGGPTVLKMYLLGDKAQDTDLVYGEINKFLQKDINAKVEVSFLSWGDWQQKYPLLFASGEDFDLIYTSNWALYASQANKGGFMEITQPMLKKYAPKTAASIYPDAWEQAKINNKVYMLPMNYKEIHGRVGLLRGDIMEKHNIALPKNWDDLKQYMDAALAEKIIPWNTGSDMEWAGRPIVFTWNPAWALLENVGVNCSYMYDITNKKVVKIVDLYNTPEYLAGAKMTKEWADQGYWSKSALVNKTPQKDAFINGTGAYDVENMNTAISVYTSVMTSHPDWKLKAFDAYFGQAIEVKPFIQNGMAIHAGSKKWQKALAALDLFKNDPRYYNLLFYGIKGKHYDIAEDGKSFKSLADSQKYPPDGVCPWGWRDDRLFKTFSNSIPGEATFRNNWKSKAVNHPIFFFNFDDSAVRNEIAAVNNVQRQYGRPIDFGMVDDIDKAITEYKTMLKAAGRDKITAEVQRQVDEFMKNYK